MPKEVMEMNCLLNYEGDAFFYGSLAEPMSCIVGSFHANYHTTAGSYTHKIGIVEGGNLAILAGAGPMGLWAIDFAINCNLRPALIVITDIDDERINRAQEILTVEKAAKRGVKLIYANTTDSKYLMSLTDGKGYDDVFVFAPVAELGDKILAKDGCLNFFAGPTNSEFNAQFNFYNVHYISTHIVGTSGGNTDDMIESLSMMEKGLIDPAAMVKHIGGLDCVAETTLNLPKIAGGKKLIYTHIEMPLTAIADFEELGKKDEMFANLTKIVKGNNNLWCAEAEKYLLKVKQKA